MSEDKQRIADLECEVAELKKQLNDLDDLISGYFDPLTLIVQCLTSKYPDVQERWLTHWKSSADKFHNPALRDPDEPLDSDEGLAVRKALYEALTLVKTSKKML